MNRRDERDQDAMRLFWRRIDQAYRIEYGEGLERAACSTCTDPACCEDAVVIGDVEAELITAHVRRHVPDALDRIERWRNGGATRFFAAMEGAREIGTPQALVAALRDYRLARLACPFLEGGRCLIYLVRPIGCRGHLVVDMPAFECRRYASGEIDELPVVGVDVAFRHAGTMPRNPGRNLLPLAVEERLRSRPRSR